MDAGGEFRCRLRDEAGQKVWHIEGACERVGCESRESSRQD